MWLFLILQSILETSLTLRRTEEMLRKMQV